MKPEPITQQRQLLVEGADDKIFLIALLDHLGIDDIQIHEIGSRQFGPPLKALVNAPHFETVTSVGVIRDGDANPGGALQSAQTAFTNAGLPQPAAQGAVSSTKPRVGVMILPDGTNPGMLEDLCLDSVQADPVIPCVDDFFQCVGETPRPHQKARVAAFLASRPGLPLQLGRAAQHGVWPWASAEFDDLKTFLTDL